MVTGFGSEEQQSVLRTKPTGPGVARSRVRDLHKSSVYGRLMGTHEKTQLLRDPTYSPRLYRTGDFLPQSY